MSTTTTVQPAVNATFHFLLVVCNVNYDIHLDWTNDTKSK